MEEMRNAALAYYANMSNDEQQLVLKFYESLDSNGDGKVTIQEYLDFLGKAGWSPRNTPYSLFKVLDKNNDGTLDFGECVTFFYMIFCHRLVFCDGCRSDLLGLHFLCVECYSVGKNSYDLCSSCYGNKKFSHEHSTFLDNYALLRSRPWEVNTSEGVDKTVSKRVNTSEGVDKTVSKRAIIKELIESYEMGYKIGTIGAQTANAATVVAHSAAGHAVAAHAIATVAAVGCTIM